ncbi:hypothetical protein DWB85_16380 [Seongchinamella sediminis]|uniref:Uncharacterized protein n=1 Tax=Seongchinamella sediminis TaxID=2283635 RepID=A0A3L7DUC2_9GAMM|nr:hypothetical protein [Seongchinamella sediminis]RLQ20706.1 hypothetical protein DWB85_16380 [Seongchinamella sediminis]
MKHIMLAVTCFFVSLPAFSAPADGKGNRLVSPFETQDIFAVEVADPLSGATNTLTEAARGGHGRLDLYQIETSADVAAAMRASGYDITYSEVAADGTLSLEVCRFAFKTDPGFASNIDPP